LDPSGFKKIIWRKKCFLGWLRLVKILLLKRAIEGDSVKALDSDGKALVKILLLLLLLLDTSMIDVANCHLKLPHHRCY